MSIRTFFQKFLLLLCIILLNSCCLDKSTSPEITKYWNHYLFEDTSENFITNGKCIENKFLCTNNYGVITFTDFETEPQRKYIYTISAGFDSKPVISKDYVIFATENTKESLTFSDNSDEFGSCYQYWTSMLDSNFTNSTFRFLNPLDEVGAISASNRFVTIIRSSINSEESSHREDLVICFNLDNTDDFQSIFSDVGVINIPNLPIEFKLVRLYSIFDYNSTFYLSYSVESNFTVCIANIDENNNISVHENPFGDQCYAVYFFKYKGLLWAHKSNYQIYYSLDGENWIANGTLTPFMTSWCDSGDYFFFSFRDKLYALGTELESLELFEFQTEDLEGLTITSISQFQSNIVLTTSNGIFYKNRNTLIENRELGTNRGIFTK